MGASVIPKTEIQLEREFVDRLSADEPAKPVIPAKPAAPAPGAKPKAEDQSGKPAAATDATDDDAENEEAEEGEDGEAAEDESEGAEGEEETAEEESAEEEAEEPAGEEDDDPEASAEAKAAAEHTQRVDGLLKDAGLKLSLKDIPAEARPLVQKKLDHAQAAITRVLQEQTRFRSERATFAADAKFREEHPELAITEILSKRPELIEKVQAEIDKLEDPDKKKLFEITLKERRAAALTAVTKDEQALERANTRADEIEVYTRRAADKLGIPVGVVEQAVALALLDKPEDSRDLTVAELDQIITYQARLLKGHTRRTALTERKAVIRERTKDRVTSTPAVRNGSGSVAPSPVGKRAPKNDEEFANMFIAKM